MPPHLIVDQLDEIENQLRRRTLIHRAYFSKLKQQHESLRQRFQALHRERQLARDQYQEIQAELQSLEELEKSIEIETARVKEQETELLRLKEDITAKQARLDVRTAADEEERGRLAAARRDLDARESSLSGEESELQEVRQQLLEKDVELDSKEQNLCARTKELEERKAALEKRRANLEADKVRLSKTEAELKEKETALEGLRQQLDGMQTTLNQQRDEQQLRQMQLNDTEERQRSEQLHLGETCKNLKSRESALREEASRLDRAREELEQLRATLDRDESDLRAQQAQLAKDRSDAKKQRLSLEILRSKLAPEQAELAKLADENQKLREQLEQHERSIQAERIDLKRQRGEQLTKCEEFRQQFEALQKDAAGINAASEALGRIEKNLKELKSLLDELRISTDGNGGSRIPPGDRGGGVTGQSRSPDHETEKRCRVHYVCWRKGLTWQFGVEVECKPETCSGVIASQTDQPLEQDSEQDNVFFVRSISEQVLVNAGDDQIQLPPLSSKATIFKLRAGGEGETGIQVQKLGKGSFAIAVPSGWKLNCEPKLQRRTPEPCRDLLLHFVDGPAREGEVSFHPNNEDQPIVVHSMVSGLGLEGNKLGTFDEIPIFGGEPPVLRPDGGDWSTVRTIVILHENEQRPRWRFVRDLGETEDKDSLLAGVNDRGQGLFSARIYNREEELIDSIPFWYTRFVSKLSIQGPSPFPEAAEDERTYAVFCVDHDADVTIEPEQPVRADALSVQDANGQFQAQIPLEERWLKSKWRIEHRDYQAVPVTVKVEWLAWHLSSNNKQDVAWARKPLSLGREQYMPSSDALIQVLQTINGGLDDLYVGFDTSRMIAFQGNKGAERFPILLREFYDIASLNSPGSHRFMMRCKRGKESQDIHLGTLSIRAQCKACEMSCLSVDELVAHAVQSHMDKYFRELSVEELRKRFPKIPLCIYICSYCRKVKRKLHEDDAYSAIVNHVERCDKAHKVHGLVQVKFERVTDPAKIRKYYVKDLPILHKCTFCAAEFENEQDSTLVRHLRENHREELFHIC